MPRPSSGNFARSTPAWAASARRFVRLSATTTQLLTASASHPNRVPISRASRRRWSIDPSNPLTSTISVFSSMTRSIRRPGCHARISMIPRSPEIENDTSGSNCQPSRLPISAAIDSCIAAWRASRSRPTSAPCQRTIMSSRAPSASATRRSVAIGIEPSRPCSMRATVVADVPARPARSDRRQWRRCRSARNTLPIR